MKIKFFYRDGDNYKDVFIAEIDKKVWDDFKRDDELEDLIDSKCESAPLFHINDFGLKVEDIPMYENIDGCDHPYVSILGVMED